MIVFIGVYTLLSLFITGWRQLVAYMSSEAGPLSTTRTLTLSDNCTIDTIYKAFAPLSHMLSLSADGFDGAKETMQASQKCHIVSKQPRILRPGYRRSRSRSKCGSARLINTSALMTACGESLLTNHCSNQIGLTTLLLGPPLLHWSTACCHNGLVRPKFIGPCITQTASHHCR